MADLSMCKWERCIQKEVCQRFIAPPETETEQIYMHFENKCSKNNDWFWFYGDRSNMVVEEETVLIEEIVKEEDVT